MIRAIGFRPQAIAPDGFRLFFGFAARRVEGSRLTALPIKSPSLEHNVDNEQPAIILSCVSIIPVRLRRRGPAGSRGPPTPPT